MRSGNAIVSCSRAFFQFVTTCPSTSRPEALRSADGRPRSRARSRARLSSISQIASQSSFTTAWSFGKCPRFLVTFRSWKFNDSIAFVDCVRTGYESGRRLTCSSGWPGPWAWSTVRPSGTGASLGNRYGQAVLHDGLRARVSRWPPLRLVRLRRERESVSVGCSALSRL